MPTDSLFSEAAPTNLSLDKTAKAEEGKRVVVTLFIQKKSQPREGGWLLADDKKII